MPDRWAQPPLEAKGPRAYRAVPMLDQPHVVQFDAQLTAVIRLTVPRNQIREVMGPAMSEVLAAVGAQGLSPAGPTFSHHFRMDPEVFDFEVGVAVAVPVSAMGRVKPGELPTRTVARTVYHGPYEGLGEAWGEFDAWIVAQGHVPAADLWECYVTHPGSDPAVSRFRTELNRPLEG
jgi:effector-binding domain-containing protein